MYAGVDKNTLNQVLMWVEHIVTVNAGLFIYWNICAWSRSDA